MERIKFEGNCENPFSKNLDALVQRAKLNDRSALTEIYTYSSPEIFRVINVLIKDKYTAEDILHDTYVKAFTRLEQLRNPDRLIPWLKMIATNTAKDWLKKSKPMLFSDLSAEEPFDIFSFEETLGYENIELNPEVTISEKEAQNLLMEILDQLPEDQRMVIGMFYYEGMSVKEISDILEVNDNTIKSRLAYGRRKIKEKILDLEKRGTKICTTEQFTFFLYLLQRL